MSKIWGALLSTLLLFSQVIHAQKPDTLIKKLDSLQKKPASDSASGKKINISQTAYNERTKINVPVYFILLGTDFTQEVTGPFHTKKKAWGKVAAFAAIEGGMFLLDKPVQRYATQLMDRNQNFKKLSHNITNFGGLYEGYTLAAFGLYGWVFKNEKMKTTTFLATQSYIVAGAVQEIGKFLTGRQRPNFLEQGETEPNNIFRGPSFSLKHGSTSFPSGHTTAAFAAATVFAQEYKDRPWVPVLYYSAATLIGLSRITENAHWISDVFAGAALGYITGLQVVRNYHRYAYLRNHKTPSTSISFTGQYNYNHVEPALVVHLR
jgi:membrane-associated PAP2 superfamily phosphatase